MPHRHKCGDGPSVVNASFNVYTDPRVRWFDFDTAGGAVSWRGHENGQIGVPGGGLAEIPTAQQAWNNDPDTPISYTYAGTTTATGGFNAPDGVNAVLFNDPNNELAGSFDCSTGGLLAVGGFWFSGQTSVFEGLTYNPIEEGEVIIQDNAGCYMRGHNNEDGEELLGHELGHSLGLAHSCGTDAAGGGSDGPCDTFEKNDALMRAFVHGDGRGARLGSDDRAAIRLLYQQPPTISIGDRSVNEGDGGAINATFTLALSRSAAATVSVAAASAEGTATSGADFQAASGTVSFPAGTITATFVVPVIGDVVDEPNETFTVNLASPAGATLARAQATGTIVDDDDPPPAISIDDRTVAEGAASNAAFLVLLSGPSKLPVTVAYATVDGTGQAGFDFTATSGTLTVSPGRTTHSIFVPIVTDTSAEGTESFTLNLSAPTNATLARAIATGTITDPPAPVHAAMYRAYNRNADYHFFTTDAASRDFAVGLGYQDESNPVPFHVLNVMDATAVPLFRMYNPNLGRHYYTADAGSRDFLMSIGMTYEKDEGFVQPTPVPGTTELFRLYNNNSGTHLFIADATQKDGILALFPGVWVQHTSVGYVFAGP